MAAVDLEIRTTFILAFGEVQEWLNWQHWKCCERGTVPWVRIPPSPPLVNRGQRSKVRVDYPPGSDL